MSKSDRFINVRSLGDLERWRLRRIEDLKLVRLDFDIAGGELRISCSLRSLSDEAAHFQNILVANVIRDIVGVRRDLRVENDLRQPVPIA